MLLPEREPLITAKVIATIDNHDGRLNTGMTGVGKIQGETMPVFDAAMRHKVDGTPLVVIAGKEYGTGSSRDWAAKGTMLLGVKAVRAFDALAVDEKIQRVHAPRGDRRGTCRCPRCDGIARSRMAGPNAPAAAGKSTPTGTRPERKRSGFRAVSSHSMTDA